jgi:hypothetical protein|tara:strand:- start:202 stop:378 length:177 start_codon:yes stop_codon:yes gene_type:complete
MKDYFEFFNCSYDSVKVNYDNKDSFYTFVNNSIFHLKKVVENLEYIKQVDDRGSKKTG